MRPNRATNKGIQTLLVAIVSFNIMPHMDLVPPWVAALAVILLGWKLLHLTRGVTTPPRAVLWGISAASTAAIFVQYGTLIGPEPASAVLVCLATSKLLETNRYRDAMFIIFTSYFLLMAYLLTSQSLAATLFMATDVLLVTMLMFHVHRQDRRNSARSFRPAMRILGLSLPVWIFLFVVFPRFSTGIMGQGSRPMSGSGFDDEVNPGSIEKLVESDETVFRVSFDGAVPSPVDLYWRGSILTEGNGLAWKAGRGLTPEHVLASSRGDSIDYGVWAETGIRYWLFVLDSPARVEPDEQLGKLLESTHPGFVYKLTTELPSRGFYSAHSLQQPPLIQMDKAEYERELALPEHLDARIFELGRLWNEDWLKNEAKAKKAGISKQDYIRALAMRWFSAQGFHYSKSPGSMAGHNPVEQLSSFLFDKKLGFCEHYAAAFATLMRASGLPARVVAGYQGGKLNDYGHYMLVRSLDAHAWTEVWREDTQNPGQGRWIRVDPTSIIAPMRLQLGGEYNHGDGTFLGDGSDRIRRELAGTFELVSAKLALAWDATQMKWNAFLLAYNFDFQKELLSKIGWQEATRWLFAAFVLIGSIAFMLALALWLRRPARRQDPVKKSWQRLCEKLESVGLGRKLNEGPLAYAKRVARERPDLAREVETLAASYASLHYGPPDHTRELRDDFIRAIRRLKITKSA